MGVFEQKPSCFERSCTNTFRPLHPTNQWQYSILVCVWVRSVRQLPPLQLIPQQPPTPTPLALLSYPSSDTHRHLKVAVPLADLPVHRLRMGLGAAEGPALRAYSLPWPRRFRCISRTDTSSHTANSSVSIASWCACGLLLSSQTATMAQKR